MDRALVVMKVLGMGRHRRADLELMLVQGVSGTVRTGNPCTAQERIWWMSYKICGLNASRPRG